MQFEEAKQKSSTEYMFRKELDIFQKNIVSRVNFQ